MKKVSATRFLRVHMFGPGTKCRCASCSQLPDDCTYIVIVINDAFIFHIYILYSYFIFSVIYCFQLPDDCTYIVIAIATIARDLYYHQDLFNDQSLVIPDLKVQLPPGGGVGSMREHFCSMLRCNFNLYQTITLHEDTKALALTSHIFTCCACCTLHMQM